MQQTLTGRRSDAPSASDRALVQAVTIAIVATALVSSVDAFGIFWRDMARRDFGAFYYSGRAWNAGEPVYTAGRSDLPNLNPPSAIAILFAPLARLPLPLAGVLWQAAGMAALLLVLLRVGTALDLPRAVMLQGSGVLLVSVSARHVWLEGQMTWLLLVPAAEAWLAYRRQSNLVAGMWLGPIVAVKPFFAVGVLVLGAPAVVGAGVTSLLLTLASLPLTTVEPWRQWLALGPRISITWPASASLWTLSARAEGAMPTDVAIWTQLSNGSFVAVAASGALLALLTWRISDRDARWTAAICLTLLISPLGWIYYLPLAAPALIALWSRGRWSRWLTAGVCLCCVPMIVPFSAIAIGRWAAVSIGAGYTWALAAIVLGAQRSDLATATERRPDPTRRAM
jgi:alpha-1,2-mannosyltransferase